MFDGSSHDIPWLKAGSAVKIRAVVLGVSNVVDSDF
ncbi:conserved hypothetical protein [Vibrio coralliirubri]|nr:conserved hypothetical protein [Vibrio coralliirubri]